MSDLVTVSRDRSRLLPPNAHEKGWRITRKEAAALGLVESEEKPEQARRTFDRDKAHVAPQQRRTKRN